MAQKVFNGPMAIFRVDGVAAAIFDSVSWNVNLGFEAIHLLGRHSPDEINITSYEAVSVTCSGYRVLNNGVGVIPKFPKLQDLLNLETITLEIVSRTDTSKPMLVIKNCVPTSNTGNAQAKVTSKVQITYTGTLAEDEGTGDGNSQQQEGAGATTLQS